MLNRSYSVKNDFSDVYNGIILLNLNSKVVINDFKVVDVNVVKFVVIFLIKTNNRLYELIL